MATRLTATASAWNSLVRRLAAAGVSTGGRLGVMAAQATRLKATSFLYRVCRRLDPGRYVRMPLCISNTTMVGARSNLVSFPALPP